MPTCLAETFQRRRKLASEGRLLALLVLCSLLAVPKLFSEGRLSDQQPTTLNQQPLPSVRINEVMASNGATLADEDGDFEDWIELHNYGTEPVDLSGWGLSDSYNNPFKWTFPEGTTIEAGAYLLVWASGKDRVSVVEVPVSLIDSGATWRYDASDVDPGADWMQPDFDAAGWSSGSAPFGYGETFSFNHELPPGVSTVYFRKEFEVGHTNLTNLQLSLQTNLGAVFYLNGVEVGRHLMSEGPLSHGTPALDIPLDGLALWVAGDGPMQTREEDGRTFVTQWTDMSGHGRHLLQSNPAAQPELLGDVLNGKPGLSFDGVIQRMATAGFATGGEITVFMVVKGEGGMNWARLFAKGTSSAGTMLQRRGTTEEYNVRVDTSAQANQNRTGSSTLFDGEWRTVTTRVEEESVSVRLDGTTDLLRELASGAGIGNSSPFVVAANSSANNSFAGGKVAEIIFYDRALNAAEIAAVESFLGKRYFERVSTVDTGVVSLPPVALVGGTNTLAVSLHPPPGAIEDHLFNPQLAGARDSLVLHTNYAISSSGEEVILTTPDGVRVDVLEPTALPRDISIGRVEGEGDAWFFFDEPTPGGGNDTTAYLGILDPPTFSHEAGFYAESFQLEISHAKSDVVILYSLDGSKPSPIRLDGEVYSYKNNFQHDPEDPLGEFFERSMRSFVYLEPLQIDDRSTEPYALAAINTTPLQEPTLPMENIFKGTVVRAVATSPNFLPSLIQTQTFFVTSEGENRFSLPVVSITTDEKSLFGYESGVFTPGAVFDDWRLENPDAITPSWWSRPANYRERGDAWERIAHVEIFETGSNLVFSSQMGLRIHGGASRAWPRKSLRLYARDQLGEEQIMHDLFPGLLSYDGSSRPISSFKRLILRNSGNDHQRLLFHDALLQSLVSHWPIEAQAYRPTVHFINGEYWGINNLRERIDRFYIGSHFNIDPDFVAIVSGGATISEGDLSDRDHFIQVANFARDNDLNAGANFDWVSQRVDIDNFAKYFAFQIYIANSDWPHNNLDIWRKRLADYNPIGGPGKDGRWRCIVFDTDLAFMVRRISHDTFAHALDGGSLHIRNLVNGLLANDGFRQRFINAFCDLMNTSFRPDHVHSELDRFHEGIAHSRAEHVERWRTGNDTGDFFKTFASERPAVIRHLITERYGVGPTVDLHLEANQMAGHIRVNFTPITAATPGLPDPTQPYPWTGTYFQGVPIELEALPEAGHRFVGWVLSPTNGMALMAEGESAFFSTDTLISLDLSEDTTVEAVFEPIPLAELPVAIHVWDFEDAGAVLVPSFTLGGAALAISPGTHPDWEAISNTGGDFATRHLRVNFPLGSTLTFSLPTTGFEAINLDFLTRRSGQGAEEMFVEYTLDGETWTSALDTPNFVTVFNAAPQAQSFDFSDVAGVADNPDFAVRFTFAQGDGGVEGNNRFDDVILSGVALPLVPPPPLPTVRINEVMASNGTTIADEDGDFEDWIELYNDGTEPIDLSGWGLSDSYGNPFKWTFPEGVMIEAGEYLLVWASGKDRAATLHTNFSLSASGEEVTLTLPDGTRVDDLEPTVLPRDVSIGRVEGEGGTWFFFNEPTPGEVNDTTAYLGILEPPTFSHTSGFYSNGFDLSLFHPDSDVSIVYTLDGSDPNLSNLDGVDYIFKNQYAENPGDPIGDFLTNTVRSLLYEEPIFVDDQSLQPDRLAYINTRFSSAPLLPAVPPQKGVVVRAQALKEGFLPSRVESRSFLVKPDIADRFTTHVLSIMTDERNLFDFDFGIYVAGRLAENWRIANPLATTRPASANFWGTGRGWERPVAMEFFSPSGELLHRQNLGMRIHGNATRYLPRKSFRLYARSEYDDSNFINFPFFEGRVSQEEMPTPIESFRRLVIRNSGQDHASTLYRDAIAQALVAHTGLDFSPHLPVVHFINGEYWGIMNIRERFDEYFLANHYGLDPAEVVILNTFHSRVGVGVQGDRQHYLNLLEFVENHDLAETEAFAYVSTQMDVDNFVRYFAAQVYLGNHDWPRGNIDYWRKRTEGYIANAPRGHDGRWRWALWDLDQAFLSANVNSLIRVATTGEGSVTPEATSLFRNLLANLGFRNAFLNQLADLRNTALIPHRVQAYVDHFNSLIEAERDFHGARWGNGTNRGGYIVNFVKNRPSIIEEQVFEVFGIQGVSDVTINNYSPGRGSLRLNSFVLNDASADLFHLETPYPWTGTYFQGVPIELEALPEPGHRFAGWVVSPTNGMVPLSEDGEPDFYSTDAVISLDLAEDTTVEAVFEPIPLADLPVAIHAWDFENTGDFQNNGALIAPSATVGGGVLGIVPGPHPLWAATPDTGADFLTQHLRVWFPLGSTLTFSLPTTGFEAITFDFLTRRSGQGAGQLFVEYTLDGETWTSALDEPDFLTILNAPPQAQSFDFSDVAGVADNPDFAVRFTFAQGDGGVEGNNRFDDVILSGVALPGTNLPPVVLPDAPAVVELAAEQARIFDLDTWFGDPDDPLLSFSIVSLGGGVASGDIDGSELTLTGLSAGEGTLVVSTSDGVNPPVTHTARLLVYGAPHPLASGDFVFSEWDPLTPAGTFPANMLFVQSNVNDPDLAEPLLFAYTLAGDAHASDDPAFPFNAANRTRLNGLGEDGISFINTGRGRDLGGAVLSLDTTGASDVRVSFTAGTVLANFRIYGLRLQYRVGLEGAWTDVTDGGAAVEYVRATDGDEQEFPPLLLPPTVADQPLVQLRWKYHHISVTSGARAMLRLDDIVVTAGEAGAATALAYAPGVPTVAQSGLAPGAVELRAVDGEGALDTDFTGTVTLSLLGEGVLSGTLSVAAVEGVALFDDWVVTGGDGIFELLATAPGLSPAVSDPILLSVFPVFLPGGDGDWTLGANWTSGTVPSSAGAGARVPAPALADRNVNLRAPVTIGSVFMETGAESLRNRLRDRSSGNTLTFNGGAGEEALLRVEGTGTGFVELQNEAGTILATDLRLTINPIYGDAEYGALRLRESWIGPGGLIKDGPGMAALTGGNKDFTGAILIEQGVLAFTEPAVPANASGVTVLDGGQLRLYSASSEANPVRVHTFGGTISLAGSGRTGVPEGEELGVLGALRYDPYSQDNVAVLTNPITFAATASVHVDGSRNELTLSGPLAGPGNLVKSGGGVVVLAGGGAAHTGGIFATNGRLHVAAVHPSAVSLGADAWLSGTGGVGAISGTGTVRVEGGVLTASSLDGANLRAVLDGPGLAGNGLLRLSGEAPLSASPAVLDLLVRAEALSPGDRLRGGLFVPEGTDLAAALAGTVVRIWVPDAEGVFEDGGESYRLAEPADLLSWAVVPGEVPSGGGPVGGSLLEVRRGGSPARFSQWVGLEVADPADQADPAIAGPAADPTASGVTNLERYAFGLGLTEAPFGQLPQESADRLFFEFPIDLSLEDLTYRVRSSVDLQDWGTIEYDSRVDSFPLPVDGWLSLPVDFNPRRFYRLDLILEP